MFRFAAFASLIFLSVFANAHEEEVCPDGKRPHSLAARHIEGGGIGYKDGYTTLDAFISKDPSQWKITPFLDLRGHVFNDGNWAANLGFGLRALLKNRVYGINSYYDHRQANHLNSNQFGLGIETLGEVFDFRMNGYLPVGTKIGAPYDAAFKTFSGNYMIVSQKYQSTMKGANAEFGLHLGKFKLFGFYAAAGPYYLIGGLAPRTWGGKARISATFKDVLTLELSDSYDNTFHNKFQGQLSLGFSFGPKSKVKAKGIPCEVASRLTDRMLQRVDRQEIIVMYKKKRSSVGIDPATGQPYFFVFVDNTSNSDGTYESPYHTLAQVEANSAPGNIVYVFPGDGTTKGMNSGISLKENQKFWGSGISHFLQTAQGPISIPVQSSSSPLITNTNIDTLGNAITLAKNNTISGFVIDSATNDAIYGANLESLDVSYCTFKNTTTYPIETTSSGPVLISLTNNQFLNNVNGIFLTLNGPSTVDFLNNTFKGQTSISSIPIEISTNNNALTTTIKNNVFDNNTTGSIRFDLNNATSANIELLNNTITNNDTGSQSSLGSSVVLISTGTIDKCSIVLADNIFSKNTSNSLYFHTSGKIKNLEVTASRNTMSNNGGGGLVLGTPADVLTLVAAGNTITNGSDTGIGIIASGTTSTGTITIKNNSIANAGNSSNGIALNQNFTTLNLSILSNTINNCEGTGIISYSADGISSFNATISGNTITNCQNLGSNAAGGIDIEQYTNFSGSVTNNTLTGNASPGVFFGSTLTAPTTRLNLSGNSCDTGYTLSNPSDGTFYLSPIDVDSANSGTITESGTITPTN